VTTLSLASLLAEQARRRPGKVGVIQGDRRVTYADLWKQARQIAAVLIEDGVEPGTRVALMCPNTVEFVTAYYGILAAGGVVVPVPTLLTADEAAHLVRDSGAALVIHHPAVATAGDGAAAAAGVPAYSTTGLGEGREPIPRFVTRQAEDLAVIFYTSGTTGLPKGAMLTHLNMVMNATVNAFDSNGLNPDDVQMGCLPLFHTYGQSASMGATFRVGATLVMQPRFEAAEALELMVREGATRFQGVPTMYIQLLRAAETAPALPKLISTTSGGAAMPVAVLEEFERVFQTEVFEGYGLSETSPTAAVNQRIFGSKPGTVGHATWGVDVAVVDENIADRVVFRPTGEAGEIVVRGHNVFAGYLNNPEATAEVMVDGWFRTGDIGTIDEDGYISIVDRRKDLVIRGGYNVYPREIEEVLARHPDIGQVAVIGVPDEERGEEVCAVVVPAPGRTVDPAEVVEWSRERLGKHKYPRIVHVVDELPLGPSHKVLKRELRKQFS
jgi:long-chain acyl-CoA synthetase